MSSHDTPAPRRSSRFHAAPPAQQEEEQREEEVEVEEMEEPKRKKRRQAAVVKAVPPRHSVNEQVAKYFGEGGLRGPMSKSDIEAIWKPEYAKDWTDEDEASFETRYGLCFRRMSKADNSRMEKTTRICLQVMRCSPYATISPRHRLWYGRWRPSPDATLEPDEFLWSQAFCDKFQLVVVHPLFGGEPIQLVMAITYAAAIFANAQSSRQLPDVSSCRIVGELVRRVKDPEFRGCLQATHADLRKELKAEGRYASAESDFLFYLGQVAAGRRPPNAYVRDDGDLVVNLSLLDVLVDALDSATSAKMGKGGIPLFRSVDEAMLLYSGCRREQVWGTSASQLRTGLKQSWRSELKACKALERSDREVLGQHQAKDPEDSSVDADARVASGPSARAPSSSSQVSNDALDMPPPSLRGLSQPAQPRSQHRWSSPPSQLAPSTEGSMSDSGER